MGEKVLILFSNKFNIEDFDNKPIPIDIFNMSGAVLASKGAALPSEKLANTYIYIDKRDEKFYKNTSKKEPIKVKNAPIIEEIKPLTDNPVKKKSLENEKNEIDYSNESPKETEIRLDSLDFEPISEIKENLRKNIYQLDELFKKQIVDKVAVLASKNNKVISENITNYLDNILDSHMVASDYMDVISSIKNERNYMKFSHSLGVSFYTMAIAKKLNMLKEDFYINQNIGRWMFIKTKKHNNFIGAIPFSSQLLKYIDHQKEDILAKYEPPITDILFDNMHDIMYEYKKLNLKDQYPSLGPDYNQVSRKLLSIAALNIDIGKAFLPDTIVNKPDKLTDQEFNLIKRHPIFSVHKIKEIANYPSQILIYILSHHRLDKDIGYPLFERDIPPETKIIVTADIYDAMTSPRFYGKKHTHTEAMQHIKELYDYHYIDLPLYLAAIHTFEEYNHEFVKERKKGLISQEKI